jgi:hypothetical protein
MYTRIKSKNVFVGTLEIMKIEVEKSIVKRTLLLKIENAIGMNLTVSEGRRREKVVIKSLGLVQKNTIVLIVTEESGEKRHQNAPTSSTLLQLPTSNTIKRVMLDEQIPQRLRAEAEARQQGDCKERRSEKKSQDGISFFHALSSMRRDRHSFISKTSAIPTTPTPSSSAPPHP